MRRLKKEYSYKKTNLFSPAHVFALFYEILLDFNIGELRAMIQNKHILNEFYRKLDAEEQLSYMEALAIYEMLHKEAVSLGAINSENILDGIEVDIKIAEAINRVGL